MTDPRWERDTLFVVCEEDFRFGPEALECPPGAIPAGERRAPPKASSKRPRPPEPAHGRTVAQQGNSV